MRRTLRPSTSSMPLMVLTLSGVVISRLLWRKSDRRGSLDDMSSRPTARDSDFTQSRVYRALAAYIADSQEFTNLIGVVDCICGTLSFEVGRANGRSSPKTAFVSVTAGNGLGPLPHGNQGTKYTSTSLIECFFEQLQDTCVLCRLLWATAAWLWQCIVQCKCLH